MPSNYSLCLSFSFKMGLYHEAEPSPEQPWPNILSFPPPPQPLPPQPPPFVPAPVHYQSVVHPQPPAPRQQVPFDQVQERNRPRQYQVQESELYAAKKETFQGRLKGKLIIDEIEVELDSSNYKRKFHHLICWEERRHIQVLGEK